LSPASIPFSAYGPNAAMCHYSATEESNAVLDAKSFYLVDSGGQYYEGTTDITRTIALGELTAEEKEHFYPGSHQYAPPSGSTVFIRLQRLKPGLCGKRAILEQGTEF